VPPGYHPEVAGESIVERTRRAADGLKTWLRASVSYRTFGPITFSATQRGS
jgi:hypothetical protein